MRRRFTVRSGLETFGPLYDDPPAPPTGDPAAGDKGTGDSKPPAGGAPPAEPPAPPADGNNVPYARFKEVNDELVRLKAAETQRETEEARKRGEHEKVAEREKTRADEAEQRAESYARRLAFVTNATGKVSDVAAAHKLATADGLMNFELDDDGNAKDAKAVETMIGELVKTYPFLKPGPANTGANWGRDHGGQDPSAGVDVEKLSAREKMELGISQASRR